MSTSPAFRHLAPVSDAAWDEIDDEARRSLRHYLSARRLVDMTEPGGWTLASVPTGRTRQVGSRVDGVTLGVREVLPLVESRCRFQLDRVELEAIDRGDPAADLDPVVTASRRFAESEDVLVFDGNDDAGVVGLASGSPHDALEIGDDYDRYPNTVAAAVDVLRSAGVGGPYGIALGRRCFRGVIESSRGGYPLLEHLRMELGGPVVWSPVMEGAVIVSLRGGDFEIVAGQDVALAYVGHDEATVTLELRGSSTFRNLAPEAAVVLRYGSSDGRGVARSKRRTGRSR